MSSKVAICNMAVLSMGGNKIISLEDETSEAILSSTFYDASRLATLETRAWTFATARALPVKLAEAPAFGYSSAFQLPTNPLCLRVLVVAKDAYLLSTLEDWVKEGDQILINQDVIYMKYIKDVSDTTKFSPGFVQAFAARLAADMCVAFTSDPDLFATYWQLYLNKLEEAGAVDGMQGKQRSLQSNQLIGVR